MSNTNSLRNNYQIQKGTQPVIIDPTNFFSPIHATHLTELPPGGLARGFSPKLLPRNIIKYQIKKKTLILDLDETLVHSSMRPFQKCADITLPLFFNGRNIFIYVLKRPYLEQFLQEMSLIYDIIIFTASLPEYAEPLLDIIDKNKVIKYRLNRSHCRHYQNIYIKDLKVINRNLKDMIIVDNNPESYLMNKENAIPILTWEDDVNDKELMNLIPVLKYLAKVDDVRTVINRIVDRSNEKVDFNAFNKIVSGYNNLNNNILNNNINVISNKNIINTNPNQNINNVYRNKIENHIPTDTNDLNRNNNNINYNMNKRIYVRKEIIGNSNINKRISLPNNPNNKYILDNSNNNIKPVAYNTQSNLHPKDSKRKIGSKTLKLNFDEDKLKQKYGNNLDNTNKGRINTSPYNQINVSNSTINIFNNKPEIKILVNGPNQKPDSNKIKKIKAENLTPIRSVKKRNEINFGGNRNSLITPIKSNYKESILTNQNFEKTYDNKITKTVSVRKLFEQPNLSSDNIIQNNQFIRQNSPKVKVKNRNIPNYNFNNGFAYNQNMVKFMKGNNVKNNNIINSNNNKIMRIGRYDNNYNNFNYNNAALLRNEKSMSDLNMENRINKIVVINPKRNFKSPDRNTKKKQNVKEKKIINNIDLGNNKVKLTKKNIIMERESFNREIFLKENFGIVV